MLDKHYSPRDVEDRIYAFWEDKQLFPPEVHPEADTSFSIVIPPPNVTGVLHMGHALDDTLQDILIRWHRMQGHATLWMPGTDHAGIATQNVVERHLRESGKSKHDLGREAFVDTVWEWAKARQTDIKNQFTRLGISPDWNRQRFTLDEGLSKAVREAFVQLYNDDLIYRGTYIVNWCPRCTSAISDIETDYVEESSYLWEMKYPFPDGSGGITVATTRPETMFGDVAVAVDPSDERYKELIGKTVVLPLANVEIPIIADDYVDSSFGTGAVKITPAHDPNDFEMGQRHKLEPIWVMDENGTMKACDRVPEALHGAERFEARKQTEALLKEAGLLMGKEEHQHNVGHCQRCSTTIEPLLSKQWFVRCEPLAKECIRALDDKDIQFIPERWTKVYLDWMTNIRDWCISRQLWWGHQIPAWYCSGCDEITVATEDPSACAHCGSADLTQETDVLDTWFSSGLWPFSTMGWPDTEADDFKRFYPTDVLVTGFDIIFFWVARMTMFGHKITGKSPFHTVYIHGLVRDDKGQKMSKSKGNTIDPLEVIDDYGADALRYALTNLVYGGQDIKLSNDAFEQGKLFANKLWNASRFVLMNLEGVDDHPIDTTQLSTMDHWVLTKLALTEHTVNQLLGKFDFGGMTTEMYAFSWNVFCDWYVEYAKKQLQDPATKANTQRVLLHVLDHTLRLLHPVMPYITEEIWQKLPHRKQPSIMVGPFPQSERPRDDQIKGVIDPIDFVIEAVRAVRHVRQSSDVPPKNNVSVLMECPEATERQALENNTDVMHHFLKLESLDFEEKVTDPPAQSAIGVVGKSRVIIDLKGAIDIDAEVDRQKKKLETLQKEHEKLSGMLNNPNFVDRAPANVVQQNRDRLEELTQQMKAIEDQIAQLVG